MRRVLHIVTRPKDPLVRMVIDGQNDTDLEVVEVPLYDAGPETDYSVLLEEVFKADSVQVW